tara:strand:+ start:299 stop:718 length:420 start_codon:yes stop_codon:yes gene_type:complete
MIKILGIQLVLCQLLFGAIAYAEENMNDVFVYYMPFDVDTYVPVTAENIVEQSFCKLAFSESSDVAKSLKYLLTKATAGAFSNKVVRMRVSRPNGVDIFVDMDGGVLITGDEQHKRLSGDDFTVLKALMESLSVNSDCS